MKFFTIKEHSSEPLAKLLGRPPTKDDIATWHAWLGEKGLKLKKALALRELPISLQVGSDGPEIAAGGSIGSVRLRGLELRIAPKFIPRDAVHGGWEAAIMAMIGRAARRRWTVHRSMRMGPGVVSFVDHVAFAYADALEDGLRGDAVRAWRTREIRSLTLRGRLLVSRQLRALATPHVLHCEVDQLDADNHVNELLHWAAKRFAEIARAAATRWRLQSAAQRLPSTRQLPRVPAIVPPFLQPQYAHWQEAVDLASLLARGQGQRPGEGAEQGYSLLVNSSTLFEDFLERSLEKCLPDHLGREWSTKPQEQRCFATPLDAGCRSYYTRPDFVVYREKQRALLVDAKYKLLADAERNAQKRPTNSDLYQLAASLVAHDCSRGLLLYPRVAGDHDLGDGRMRSWKVRFSGRELIISAVALELTNLGSQTGMEAFDRLLACQITTALKHKAEEAVANIQ